MCGFAGFLDKNSSRIGEEYKSVITMMMDEISYRGPDDSGTWVDAKSGVVLGHRRLSIIDLSPSGHQPMVSSSGRFIIVFNGEIYNYLELRKELESHGLVFRGHSDTEVMLSAIEEWGLKTAVSRFIGMFAFAIWDKNEQLLHLVRDRLGIKPVYWGNFSNHFLFASELKALRACPVWDVEVCRDALMLYARYGYVPAPWSIYKNIYKLEPGSILTIKLKEEPKICKYWRMDEAAEKGIKERKKKQDTEYIEELNQHLSEAVKCRMISDVPLGAFLSGGVDSSTVVALMQAHSSNPVKTFSIGFHEKNYNEAEYAKAIANHLGTDHTELYLQPEEAMEVIPKLATIYDEPFSDSSQLPTYLISELARRHVTVSLSGDGGDEIFAGYNRYIFAHRLYPKLNRIPAIGKDLLGKVIHAFSPESWSAYMDYFPEKMQIPQVGDKLYKLADTFKHDHIGTYKRIVSCWDVPEEIIIGSKEPDMSYFEKPYASQVTDLIERMQLLDSVTYLPDDILTKLDRASMAVSLEARVPLLDHRVVEYAWTLPMNMKIHNGKGKWLLRQLLYKYVPMELIERPKMGFAVPIESWLRGPLRDWAESLLDEKTLRMQGYLHPASIRNKWLEHLSGKRNWQHLIWNILMFQGWLSKWS